jgi:ribonuclease Z
MGQLNFLGTGSALPSADRANTALAINADGASWLQVDAGGDPYRALLRGGIAADGVKDVVITHAHIDHVGGLPSLIESFRIANRRAPLRIWAIPEVLTMVNSLLALYSYELTLDHWPFAVTLHTIEPGHALTLAGIPVRAARMDHALPSIGLRLELPRGPICYSCDTQPTPALSELARDAALLITECTFLGRDESFARLTRHMTAVEAGRQATASGAQMLALVHLGAAEGWNVEDARVEAASSFSGPILIPFDGQVIEV